MPPKYKRLSARLVRDVREVLGAVGPFEAARLLTLSHMTVRSIAKDQRVADETRSRVLAGLPAALAHVLPPKPPPEPPKPPPPPPRKRPERRRAPSRKDSGALDAADGAALLHLTHYIDAKFLALTLKISRKTLRAA